MIVSVPCLSTLNHYHERKRELMDRLNARYHADKIGPWWVYVKNSLDDGDKA